MFKNNENESNFIFIEEEEGPPGEGGEEALWEGHWG